MSTSSSIPFAVSLNPGEKILRTRHAHTGKRDVNGSAGMRTRVETIRLRLRAVVHGDSPVDATLVVEVQPHYHLTFPPSACTQDSTTTLLIHQQPQTTRCNDDNATTQGQQNRMLMRRGRTHGSWRDVMVTACRVTSRSERNGMS